MTGSIKDAVAVLTKALLSKSSVFVRKPEFSQEVVRLHQQNLTNCPLQITVWEQTNVEEASAAHLSLILCDCLFLESEHKFIDPYFAFQAV